jgi:hypothetical protein
MGEGLGLQRGTWLISVTSIIIVLTFALPRMTISSASTISLPLAAHNTSLGIPRFTPDAEIQEAEGLTEESNEVTITGHLVLLS